MVIATQNPFEFEGTYPLPESQLDRFLLRISVGYPEREDELQVLTSHRGGEPVDRLEPVLDAAQILALQEATRRVAVEESIADYLLDIVSATRHSPLLQVGVSTRGALCLYRADPVAGGDREPRLRRSRRRQAAGRAGAGAPRDRPVVSSRRAAGGRNADPAAGRRNPRAELDAAGHVLPSPAAWLPWLPLMASLAEKLILQEFARWGISSHC